MVKIAIFASGSGSNFENIVEHIESGKLENIYGSSKCVLYK